MKTAIILGAGFSRALSKRMPLVNELGEAILKRTGRIRQLSVGGDFEMLLSRLAEWQPDLRDDRNYQNRMLFHEITKTLHSIMTEREAETLRGKPPWWLLRLLGIAHVCRMTLITFNYDTLIEHAVNAYVLYDWEARIHVLAEHILNRTPILAPGTVGPGTGREPRTFRLAKLHGSLDTFWVPSDRSGATINRQPLGRWGNPIQLDELSRSRYFPGRSPFIVPPAAAKSTFYDNPISRELWQTAAEALRIADQVAIVGYSLPLTDLVTSGMLAETLGDREVEVDVVNCDPRDVVNRLRFLGVNCDMIRAHGGCNAVEEFVDEIESVTAQRVVTSLGSRHDDLSLTVAASDGWGAIVTGAAPRGSGTIDLQVGQFGQIEPLQSPGAHVPEAIPYSLGQLKSLLGGTGVSSLEVRNAASGRASKIIEVAEWATPSRNWLALIPSALPSE
jgi:hypothetical protein